jgi:replicative superfamily II helicase
MTIEDVEYQRSLENFKTLEELEYLKAHLLEELADKKAQLEKILQESDIVEYERKDLLDDLIVDGSIIAIVSTEFRNDYEVMLRAVMHYDWALCYASVELQNDYEIVYQALKKNPNQLEWVSDELQKEAEFIKMYINYWVGENQIYKTLEEFLEFHPLALEKEKILENVILST